MPARRPDQNGAVCNGREGGGPRGFTRGDGLRPVLRILQLLHRRFGAVTSGALFQAWRRAAAQRDRAASSSRLSRREHPKPLFKRRHGACRHRGGDRRSWRARLRLPDDAGAEDVVGRRSRHKPSRVARFAHVASAWRGRRDSDSPLLHSLDTEVASVGLASQPARGGVGFADA